MSDASPPSTYIIKGEMIGVRRDPMKAAPNAVKTTGRLAIEFLSIGACSSRSSYRDAGYE